MRFDLVYSNLWSGKKLNYQCFNYVHVFLYSPSLFTLIGINMVDEWKTWLVVHFWTPLCTLSKGSLAQTHYAAIKSTIKCMTQEQKHFCVIKEKLSQHTVSSRKTVLECMRYMKVCITRLDTLFDWWWPGFGCRLPCSYNSDLLDVLELSLNIYSWLQIIFTSKMTSMQFLGCLF